MGAQIIVLKKVNGKYETAQQENLTDQMDASFKRGAGLIFSPDQHFFICRKSS